MKSKESRQKKALIIFTKLPRPGKVKTRLQPEFSQENACRIYQAFIRDTLFTTASLRGVERILGCDPDHREPFFRNLAHRHGLTLINQAEGDLGRRMRNAIAEAYRRGFGRVVIIGTDSPTLPVDYIREAFRRLQEKRRGSSLVLGPCTDGGYYLVGCSGGIPPIFEGITWSSAQVMTQTLQQVVRKGLKAHLLPFWYDTDTVQDIRFLAQHLAYYRKKKGPCPAPETAHILRKIGWK